MNSFSLKNAMIYDSEKRRFIRGGIAVSGGVITEVGQLSPEAEAEAEDMRGTRVIPAMVDVHTHGRCGIDFCGADENELRALRRAYVEAGTATVVPTLASDTFENWMKTVNAVRAVGFDAIHFEGRYLAPGKRGAHAESLLCDPDIRELEALTNASDGIHVHLSFAAERPGGDEFIKAARKKGVTVGLAHTEASYEQSMDAVRAGITSFTHTFNAMKGLSHRAPGTVGAALTSGCYAEFICDGVHIHPAVIKLAYRAMPKDKFVLVTDSLMAAGLGDGRYTLAGLGVTVKDGVARTDDGAIAGSMLDMYTAMLNLMKFADITIEEAIPCATLNPAKMLLLDGITGALKKGLRADICVIGEENMALLRTYAAGERI